MTGRFWIPFFCFVATLIIYLVTLAPSVDFVDAGELAAVVATLGIAHPTGYPLYTILGHVFSKIPIETVAWRTNLLSAIFSAFTVAAVAWIVLSLLVVGDTGQESSVGVSDEQGRDRGLSLLTPAIAAVIAAGYLAFSMVHWTQAVTTEVYPLTMLLAALLLGGLLLWFPRGDNGSNRPLIFLWCYLWGLGFGNHMMIVFLAPVALLAVLLYGSSFDKPIPTFALGGLFFLLGVSVCLYLPIRSSLHPVMNWGDPETWGRLWNHLTAKQYRIWMFSQGIGAMMSRFVLSLGHLWHWISPPGVLLAAVGFVASWFVRPKINWILLILLLADLIYSLNYDIPDIDPYYLPSHLVIAIWAGLGSLAIANIFRKYGRSATAVAGFVLATTLIWPISQHWDKANHHGDVMAEYIGKGALDSAPIGALVMHSFWDISSIGDYLQQVEQYRTDVVLIDLLLMERSWYVRQQQEQHPEIFEGVESETDDFLETVADFEAGRPYDPKAIENSWIAMINGMIARNVEQRRVLLGFLDKGKHPGLAQGFNLVPREVFFEVNPWEEFDQEPPLALKMQYIARPEWARTDRTRWFLDQLATMAVLRAQYRSQRGEYNTALNSLDRASQLRPYDRRIFQAKEELKKRLSGSME
jgi:hypothetical protein